MTKEKAPKPAPSDTGTSPGDEAAPGTTGTGENICPDCKGSGRLSTGPCQKCSGTGRIIEGVGGG